MAEHVVSLVVERLGDLLIQEAKFLSRVSHQVKNLQNEMKWMQSFLKDADAKQDKDERILKWIAEIRDTAYDAQDVVETYYLEESSKRTSRGIKHALKRYAFILSEAKHAYKVGSEISDIKAKISELTKCLETYGINRELMTSSNPSTISINDENVRRELRRTYSHVIENDLVGLEESVELLVKQLKKDEKSNRVVSIYGMGGVGKTTRAKTLYHHGEIRSNFTHFAWSCISQTFQTRDVWEGILIRLKSPNREEREDIKNMREDELAKELYKFQQEKKCLVVLDDIWSSRAWDRLESAFPSEGTRSKILLTTRKKDVGSRVDSDCFNYEATCLSDNESWQLFRKKAFPATDKTNMTIAFDMEQLGKKMVRYCGGLPLAIKVLGGILVRKDTIEDWNMVHESIKSFLGFGEGLEKGTLPVSEVLALSYNDLPYHLKPCFLYLGIFPEDFEVPSKKLIQMWIAEGFVAVKQEERITMEDRGRLYLDELVQRSMIQVGEWGSVGGIKTCHLHDLMRDMCSSKANIENFMTIVKVHQNGQEVREENSMSNSLTSRTRRFAIYLDGVDHKYILSQYEKNPYIRSLVYFHDKSNDINNLKRIIKPVFDIFKLLRVLHLEGICSHRKLEIPKEMQKFVHLRYLSFKDCQASVLLPPSISNLRLLQTLDVRIIGYDEIGFRMELQMPDVLWKMKQLRHLYLPETETKLQLHLANDMSNMQTLVNFPWDKYNIKELFSLTSLRKLVITNRVYIIELCKVFKTSRLKINTLRSLTLQQEDSCQGIDFRLIVSCCPHVLKLYINGQIEQFPESHLFPPTVTKVTLRFSHVPNPVSTLEQLPNLRVLELLYQSLSTTEIVCSRNGFPQLRSLILNSLYSVERWTIEEGGMPNLQCLNISHLPSLKTFPDGLKSITTLQEIHVNRMSSIFEQRHKIGGVDFHKVEHVPSIIYGNCLG